MGWEVNTFLRASALSAFAFAAGPLLGEGHETLEQNAQNCAEETTSKFGTVSDYLECSIGARATEGYFYGRQTLDDDIYEGLLETCSDVRGLADSKLQCRSQFPQSFNYDGFMPLSSEVSFEKAIKCSVSPVDAPYATTNDFLVCAIGEAQYEQYEQGARRLSLSAQERTVDHCLIARDGLDASSQGCYSMFPAEKGSSPSP